ncbi:ABC transporter substrate-binding protein [Thermodesulfobacteriota bacterium]
MLIKTGHHTGHLMSPHTETGSRQRLSYGRTCGVLACVVLLLFACAPKPTVKPPLTPPEPPRPVIPDTGERLFFEAETLLAQKSYANALNTYDRYLQNYPGGQFVAKALFNAASIHMVLDNADQARAYYKRLIDQYPDSLYVPEAWIEILTGYYKQGKYTELVDQAAALPDDLLTDTLTVKKYLLLGDTYLAMDFPVDSVSVYTKALDQAPEAEKDAINTKLKNAVFHLEHAEIMYLLGLVTDDHTVGYLMYQLGLNRIAYEKYEDALATLTTLLRRFPEHEMVPQVNFLIDELKSTLAYDRYAVGCLLPLSGRYKTYGHRALNAIKLALSQYALHNQNPSIRIVVKDTAADPEITARRVDELFNEKVAAIIGPLIHVEPAAAKAQEKEIPIITLTQKENITDIGGFVFRNFFTPHMQVKSLVSYVVEELGLYRFAILYPNEHYGSTYMNLFWDEVVAHDGMIVGVEAYDPTLTDFAEPIKKIVGLYYDVPEYLVTPVDLIAEKLVADTVSAKEVKPKVITRKNEDEDEPRAIVDFDAVFIPDSPKQAGLIIPQLAFYDVNNVFLLGTNLWHSSELVKMARQYVQTAIIPDGFFAGSSAEPVQDFVKNFQDVFNTPPGYIEAISFDTASILLQLIGRPGVRTRWKLKEALQHHEAFQGVTGSTVFTNTGEVEKELYLLRIKGNRFVELKRDVK